MEAWDDLSTCRPIGMVVGRIPWTAIDTWTQRQRDLDDDARAIIARAIRYVDDIEFAERTKKQTPKPPGTSTPRPRVPAARGARAAHGGSP